MSHTLLAVTGMSPAVVTETLYAIHKKNLAWPDSIKLITTAKGKEKLIDGLPRAVAELCAQYNCPRPRFEDDDILVVPSADGVPVDDARSVEDHEALGDFIMQTVRNVTADDDSSVHASIAGGRKTMTFYLGYAMSLFGRAQDTLSHVLVSEQYEGVPNFYFPTTAPQRLKLRDGSEVDARDAEVVLADIPFIRLRDTLPKVMLRVGQELHFRDLVALADLGTRPKDIRVRVARTETRVEVFDLRDGTKMAQIEMTPLHHAFYRMLARVTVRRDPSIRRPKPGEPPDTDIAMGVIDELFRMEGLKPGELPLKDAIRKLQGLVDWKFRVDDESYERGLASGVTPNGFDQRRNKIVDYLKNELPDVLLRWIEPRQIFDASGALVDPEDSSGKGGAYGIPLPPSQIELVD